MVLCAFHPCCLTSDKALYDRDPEDLSAAGAGLDPDGSIYDWRLARALILWAGGFGTGKAANLPDCRGFINPGPRLYMGRRNYIPLSEPSSPSRTYIMLVSDDLAPGIRLRENAVLPLAVSNILFLPLASPGVFKNFVGNLDGRGKATACLDVPYLQGVSGYRLYFSFIVANNGCAGGICSVSAVASSSF